MTTEGPGRRPGLSTTALLAPAAAAVLAGSLAWADSQPPTVPVKQAAATAAPACDPSAAELRQTRRDVERLRQQVRSLRAELTDMQPPATGSSPTRSSNSSGTPSGGGTTTTPRPTSKPKPTPAARPPVDTTTGAS